MAKLFGLNGYASGKLGNTVLAIYNGTQVARQYQPVVSNPKSALQNAQRAKGNLAGRVSSFTPKAAIFGLGSNARRRRAVFLKNLLNAATVTQVDGVFTAKVADEDMVFSIGAVPLSIFSSTLTAASHTLSISFSGYTTSIMPADIYAKYQTRIVVMVYDIATQNLVEVTTKIATKPEQGSAATTQINIAKSGGYIAVVYAVPMATEDGSAVSIDTSLAGRDDNDIAAALSVNRNAVVFNYGRSIVLGSTTFEP